MRGKGAASLVLFATLGVGAAGGMCGCATAGNPDDSSPDSALGGDSTTRADGAAIGESGGALDSTAQDDGAVGDDSAPDASAGDAAEKVDVMAPDYDARPGDELFEGERDSAPVDATLSYGDSGGVDAAIVPDAGAPDTGTADGTAPAEAGIPDAAASDGGALDAGAVTDAAPGDAAASGGGSDAASGVSDAASEAAACGGCAAGFSCGPSGYCVSPSGIPAFDHVYVVVMEQQSLGVIQGNPSAPYINSLIAKFALATNYSAPDHPSLPNYFELTSGGMQGVVCDCQPGGIANCTAGANCVIFLQNSCSCPQSVMHLGDQLDTAGIAWREYAEGMGVPCNTGGFDAGANFALTHVPFLYYDDMYTAGRCVARVRDYGDFAADLASGVYRFSLISPDTCDDMQNDCTGNAVLQGDDWLSTNAANILATAGFSAGGRDVVFIVWDEAGLVGAAPLPLIVVSPLALHVSTAAAYTHYSLLATIEDGLGVPRLGSAVGIPPISDVWR